MGENWSKEASGRAEDTTPTPESGEVSLTAEHAGYSPLRPEAADALKAAEAADEPESRDAFRALAEFYIQTIKCDGNEHPRVMTQRGAPLQSHPRQAHLI